MDDAATTASDAGQNSDAASSATAPSGRTFSQTEVNRMIADERRKEREKITATITQTAQSETERITQERDRLVQEKTAWERERQETRLAAALAAVPGVLYPDLLLAKIDPGAVEWAADGSVKNAGALVQPLRARYPALFAAGGGDGGAGQTGRLPAGADMDARIRAAAGR